MQNFVNTISYEYLWDLFSVEKGVLYKKMKQKYGFSFSEDEEKAFMQLVLAELESNPIWQEAHHLIVPQTGNQFLLHLLDKVNKNIHVLKKKSKADIFQALEGQDMMKAERIKLYQTLDDMKEIKMALIAGNQRKRFIGLLFDKLEVDVTEGLFFDDSVFSGYTFLAAQEKINFTHQNLVLFSKH